MPRGPAKCLQPAGGVSPPGSNRAIARGTAIVTRRAETPKAAWGAKRLEPVSGEAGCPLIPGDRIDQFVDATHFHGYRKDGRFAGYELSHSAVGDRA